MSIVFLGVYQDLITRGKDVAPRGQAVIELENYMFHMRPDERFTSFKARHMSFEYLKEEFLWYLRADPFDRIIEDHAQMWKNIRQEDGSYFSNYGQYWFGPSFIGFNWVVHELRCDPDSRRAVIPMLANNHCFQDNPDVVCTESISFRIRDGKLNMSVNMRSQDAIWGMTNDVACFHFLWEMIAAVLGIPQGVYAHKVDSLHIYERHFDMAQQLVSGGMREFKVVDIPKISKFEAVNMPRYHLNRRLENDNGPQRFFDWLKARP